MPLFDKNRLEIFRSKLRALFKRKPQESEKIVKLGKRERLELLKEAFPKKFGKTISKQEYFRAIQAMRKAEQAETDFQKKRNIRKKIKFLKQLENQAEGEASKREIKIPVRRQTAAEEEMPEGVAEEEIAEQAAQQKKEQAQAKEPVQIKEKVKEVEVEKKETEQLKAATITAEKTPTPRKVQEAEKEEERRIAEEFEKTKEENPEIFKIKADLYKLYGSTIQPSTGKAPTAKNGEVIEEEEESEFLGKPNILQSSQELHGNVFPKKFSQKGKSFAEAITGSQRESSNGTQSPQSLRDSSKQEATPVFEKPDILKDNLSEKLGIKRAVKAKADQDTSIFGGKDEISRLELRRKLRYDPKVWKAGVQTRFNLTREQRENLEKELFSEFKIYGKNISKEDFKHKLKLMARERMSAAVKGNFVQQEKLRREINFLKKIGGIK